MNSISDRMSGMASGDMASDSKPEMNGESEHEGGDVKDHLMKMHAKMGGKHTHMHSDEMSNTSHHMSEDGKHHGPVEHESADQMIDYAKKHHAGGEENGEGDKQTWSGGGNNDLMG
jgi:hypothetical protein